MCSAWEGLEQCTVNLHSHADSTMFCAQAESHEGGVNATRNLPPGVKEGVFGDNARAADAEQRAQDLGRLVGALRDAGPQPAVCRTSPQRAQRRRRLPHHLPQDRGAKPAVSGFLNVDGV